MKINSVQELEDKSISFDGELSPTETALVVSMGLNTMISLGLMHLLPGLTVEETDHQDSSNRH